MRKLLIFFLAVSACLLAQNNPLSSSIKMEYGMAKDVIIRSADQNFFPWFGMGRSQIMCIGELFYFPGG